MSFKNPLLLTLSLIALQAAQGGEITYVPTHDAFTQNGDNRNLNELRVEHSGRIRITYLQFDLSSLAGPPSAATLFLTGGSDKSSGEMTIRVYAAESNDWDESEISGDTAPKRGLELTHFMGNIEIGQVVEFDVASMITGPGIYSLIVENDDSALDVSFVSKEGDVPEDGPRLVVTEVDLPPAVTGYAYDRSANEATISWEARPGSFYDVEVSTAMSPGSWETAFKAMATPTPDASATVPGSVEAAMQYLRVLRVPAPPLLESGFENGGADWSVSLFPGGRETATTWEFGPPTNGPGAARTGTAAAGTGLSADYDDGTTVQLRSPLIDPTGTAGSLTLSFWYYLDAAEGEGGQVGILEANGDLIGNLETLFTGGEEGNTEGWTEFRVTLPDLDPVRPFLLQFQFLSIEDGAPTGAGWFIDDVRVGK